jgi:aminoglycoside phosphotransferase (APT) family kinase protein
MDDREPELVPSRDDDLAPTARHAAPWASEFPDAPVIAALLERHNLPALRSIQRLTEDDDHTLILNDDMVLLSHHGEAATSTLVKQAVIYRRLGQGAGVPCPKVLALDTSRQDLPYEVLILSRMYGINAATVWNTLSDPVRETLSEETGRMIGSVHGLPWSAYGDFDPGTGTFGQYARWTDRVLVRVEQLAEEATRSHALPQRTIDSVVTTINDGDSVLETASAPVLVHGDLHTANLLIDQQNGTWHVVAVLDWESASTADAAWEFAGLWIRHAEREPFHDAFLYGYRERHPAQIDLQSRILLYRMILHFEGAVVSRRPDTRDEARRARHEAILTRMLRRL